MEEGSDGSAEWENPRLVPPTLNAFFHLRVSPLLRVFVFLFAREVRRRVYLDRRSSVRSLCRCSCGLARSP